jgi:hypothetical protein
MNAHVRLQLVSVITKESEKARNPICALGIMLRGLRRVDVYCRLGGTVEKAVTKFFNGSLLVKLQKAIVKGWKNAFKAYEKKNGVSASRMAAIEAAKEQQNFNHLPQYQGKEIDGDYSSWLVSNNMD